ncbi:MAG: class II glutamine amidotransferase [Rickettsiaceae bacterium]
MCRFVTYIGKKPILLSNILNTPKNSLLNQSRHSKESNYGSMNADGFGLAWYKQEISKEAGMYKSTQPMWNDINLKHISNKITSDCFLSHVRASTIGTVSISNCHPFVHKEYAFVHNGEINHFNKIHRQLLLKLEDELFDSIGGHTDSEHTFFLIMHFLMNDKERNLEKAVHKAFAWILDHQKNDDDTHYVKLNISITNGNQVISTRFSSKTALPESLHYTTNLKEETGATKEIGVLVASEPVTEYSNNWEEVPINHYLVIDKNNLNVQLKSF